MAEFPRANQIYRHFKGNLYRIIAQAVHGKTGEEMVVYQALQGDYRVYVRELSDFMAEVDRKKYPHADQRRRFELVPQIVGQEPGGAGMGTELMGGAGAQQRQGQVTETGNRQQAADAARPTAGQERAAKGAAPADAQEGQETEVSLDPLLMAFLDADTYEEKLNVLVALRGRITDDMINTMAVSLDVEVNDGDLEERYEALKYCLLTMKRYECNRLR